MISIRTIDRSPLLFLAALVCAGSPPFVSSAIADSPKNGAEKSADASQSPSDQAIEQLISPSQLDFDEASGKPTTGSTERNRAKAKGSPEATVLALVQELRQTGNALPILDYIDWETTYTTFRNRRVGERERLQITSAENLRGFYEDLFRQSPNIMLRKLGPRLGTMTVPEQRKVLDFFKGMDERSRAKEIPRDPNLTESLYEIQKTEKTDVRATVILLVTRNKKTQTQTIGLIPRDGLWYLDGVYIVDDPFRSEYR